MKAPPKASSPATALRRSSRNRTLRDSAPPYQGVVVCENVRDYKRLVGKTPVTCPERKKKSKKDQRRKSTSEMKILSKKAERKQLQSTPTNVSKSRRDSLQPKKLFSKAGRRIGSTPKTE